MGEAGQGCEHQGRIDEVRLLRRKSPYYGRPYHSAEKVAAWNRRNTHNTRPANLFGQCGASLPLPAGPSALPIGLQLVCRAGDDARLLAIAQGIEAVLGKAPARDLRGFVE